ncbi:hypothetical protein A4D02_35970 [Niastella koreensis]|uniref:Uncharacterized protein n=2 Tax=Niastella koreensis TaxID=354356 RepID=G8TAM0_NIAKG|nr:hypothetical protein [Niastella koreensis]AEV99200.1 hypothetical protein Niako_2866 [Niastella koreensis GR20-10]OQP42033.1 hypothetical protein A4D02_35970 [Niastella koreensis]
MKEINLVIVLSLFCFCTSKNKFNRNIIITKLHPAILFDSLNKKVSIDSSIQFYYPYRGYRQNVMQVVLGTPYSAIFDLMANGNIVYINEKSKLDFSSFTNRVFKGDFHEARRFVNDKIEMYKKSGIDAIARGKDFLHIQTLYMDSSYALLKSVNEGFSDSFYLKAIEGNSSYKGYCIAFYFFDKEQNSLPFHSPYRVTTVNSKLFYYRKPVKNICDALN